MTLFRGSTPTALAFGTSGLRGLVTDITDIETYINTAGFLDFAGAREGRVALAGDLRPSTDRILVAAAKAIQDAGCEVDYLGKIPTPALASYAIERSLPHVMVTGSHIPFDRNGIKFGKTDGEVLKDDEPAILDAVGRARALEYGREASESPFDDAGALETRPELPQVNPAGADDYVRRYLEFFPPGALNGLRIVVFEHSAVGRDLVVTVLESLGADVVRAGRSERFIPIDTEDITAEKLADLQRMVDDAGGADAIVSTDGDTDRPLVAGVTADGTVRFVGGDLLGILVAKYVGADYAAVPISANDAVDLELGDIVRKTRIGSPHVVRAMLDADGDNVVGWEANGGFLTGSVVRRHGKTLAALPTRDAVLPIVAALHAAVESRGTVVDLVDALPKRYSKAGLLDDFPREMSLDIVSRFTPGDFDAIRAALALVFTEALGFGGLSDINVQDGLRLTFDNGDIAHVRPSGNAPQLRIYAVANDQSRADEIVRHAIKEPDGILRALERSSG